MIKKALCIGNAFYPEAPLKNPVNDATGFTSKLQALGFLTEVLCDAKFREMEEALKQFASELQDSEVGLFFFAGHGMQIDDNNYLTAVDTDFHSETDAKFSSLQLNKVIDVLEKGNNATSIIILDACRSNPYERRWRNIGSRGLAPVYAPKGTIIAFATSPGQVALDGEKENGAFTSALLKHVSTQNITIEDLFKRVRNTLSASTSGKQISWEHTSLMGDFFFNPAILSSDFIAEYSPDALADEKFSCADSRPLSNIIKNLRSHDWYSQNPAFSAISRMSLEKCTKDELFVLGRNMYQTACGGSNQAESYFSDLSQKLHSLNKEVAFHVLNGMLFEIYFDSNGRFRKNKKTYQLDTVFLLEDSDIFRPSFEFIRQFLLPYQKQLFYIPGIGRDVVVDVNLSEPHDDECKVNGILVDGQDVFYSTDGETLISNVDKQFYRSETVPKFEQELINQMVTPKRRIRITYSQDIAPKTYLEVPYDYLIQRFSA